MKFIIKIKLTDFEWTKKSDLYNNLLHNLELEGKLTIDQYNDGDTNLIELWLDCCEEYEPIDLYEEIFKVITDTLEGQPTGEIEVIGTMETFEF
jgi:hypothetical protein